MLLFIIFIVSLIILLSFSIYQLNKEREGLTNPFTKEQQIYYGLRNDFSLPINPDGEKFYKFNSEKPLGEQLEIETPQKLEPSDIEYKVRACRSITNCSQLDNPGNECGYCFDNNKFRYGDDKGPYTDECKGGWVTSAAECQEYRERAICDKITNCNDMIGEASICAWCPTTNKAMPYIEQDSILVPKYPDKDNCDITDSLGLIKQSNCGEFAKNHPCVGPNQSTGPHSMECLQDLWSKSGCSDKGSAAPKNNPNQVSWWNKRGWEEVFADMKAWFNISNSPSFDRAKSHYKGCYGEDIDSILKLHFDEGINKDCTGNDIKYYYPYSPNDCAKICKDTPECVAMVTGPTNQCWLKSKYVIGGPNPNRTCWKKLS